MFQRAGVLFFYTLTPLHPGSGASVTAVDLPIQRERHTHFPLMQASGVKGALRDLADQLREANQLGDHQEVEQKIEIVFGPKTDRASDHGGALAPTDARVLLFPVRSVRGVFAWITCPGVIERFKRDLAVVKAVNGRHNDSEFQELEQLDFASSDWDLEARQACTPPESNVVLSNNRIILEDFCFELVSDNGRRRSVQQLAQWLAQHALPDDLSYWKEKLKRDLVVLSDDAFREFVEMSTEVITRIKLGETGTVDTGPWDEEHLPSETLLYGLALATDPKLDRDRRSRAPIQDADGVIRFLDQELVAKAQVMQFGGDETVGKGLVKVRLSSLQDQQGPGEPAGGEGHDD